MTGGLELLGTISPASVKQACVQAQSHMRPRLKCSIKRNSTCIKFRIILWKNSVETFETLKIAFGDECLSHGRTFEWFKRFKGQTSVNNNLQSGQASTNYTDYSVIRG
jgi:hypothetical protein